jgi:hypothetical protein
MLGHRSLPSALRGDPTGSRATYRTSETTRVRRLGHGRPRRRRVLTGELEAASWLCLATSRGRGGLGRTRDAAAAPFRAPLRRRASTWSDATIRHSRQEERLGDPWRYAIIYVFLPIPYGSQAGVERSFAQETSPPEEPGDWRLPLSPAWSRPAGAVVNRGFQAGSPASCNLLGRNGRTPSGVPLKSGIACR